MRKECESYRNEVFYCSLISKDMTKKVDTSYTLGDFEKCFESIGEEAVEKGNTTAQLVASLMAYDSYRLEEALKSKAKIAASFEVFREEVERIIDFPDSEIKSALTDLIESSKRAELLLDVMDLMSGE